MKKSKIKKGIVVSNKMDKTVVVKVETLQRHSLYGKVIKLRSKFKAHDEKKQCKVGDVVEIMGTKPISKDKRYKVVSIVKKAGVENS